MSSEKKPGKKESANADNKYLEADLTEEELKSVTGGTHVSPVFRPPHRIVNVIGRR